MDILVFIILVLILCAVIFLVYYFFRGAKGNISLTRPVESRVDEYLDRRFQSMVDEWELYPTRNSRSSGNSAHGRSSRMKHALLN